MNQQEQEVRRLTELLDAIIRVTRHTRRDIEQQLGLGSAALSKILSGTVRLQVIHLLMIAEAVGMTPGEFFKLAYPGVELRSPAARSAAATLGLSPDSGTPEVAGEFEERVKQALLHLLGGKSG